MDDLNKQRLELAKLKRMHATQLNECFSHLNPSSKPTTAQQEFLDDLVSVLIRWVVASNRSGKSGTAAREAAWIFNNSHPKFQRPEEWGTGPILMIILGKKIEQMQTALWEGAIKPLLPPGCYKEKYGSSGLEKVIHLQNGNTILFQSHNNPQEARKNVQGYDAHWVWIDEMPESSALIGELVTRLVSINGRLCATFTPLVHNMEIKKLVEGAKLPISKRYFFSIYDNPVNAGRIDEIIATIKAGCATEDEFECRVNGKWIGAGNRVSCYNNDRHYRELPSHYHPMGWRHLGAVDPSASGKTGLSVWAEDPTCGEWYNVKAKYLQGDAAFLLVEEVEKEFTGYHMVLKITDSNPAGFWKEAARRGLTYRTVGEQKYYGKSDFIDGANTALVTHKVWLTEASSLLEDELVACVWNDLGEGKIVNASKYHLFDTMQYAIANLPPYIAETHVVRTFDQQLRHDWNKVKMERAKKTEQKKIKILQKRMLNGIRSRRNLG